MPQRRVRVAKDNRPVEDRGTAPEPDALPPDCGCPMLDPEDWHEVESDWSDIAFLPLTVPALAGIPIGHNHALDRGRVAAAARGLTIPDDPMVLIGPGRFRRPVLVEVEGGDGVDGTLRPGGFAFSRLLPAPPGAVKRLADETIALAVERYERPPDTLWLWLLTCRSCDAARNFETLFVAHYASPSP